VRSPEYLSEMVKIFMVKFRLTRTVIWRLIFENFIIIVIVIRITTIIKVTNLSNSQKVKNVKLIIANLIAHFFETK